MVDKEVKDEIESALKDPNGIVSHQKRLAFCLSLGTTFLLEDYLNKKNVLKKGLKINHQWFKKSKKNIKEILSERITCPVEQLTELDNLLDSIYKIESKRNELAYGKASDENTLKELISLYLSLEKEAENE
ncbi:MAG: hypothetical protein AABX85_03760 [Nanoarchaeota archaeon]